MQHLAENAKTGPPEATLENDIEAAPESVESTDSIESTESVKTAIYIQPASIDSQLKAVRSACETGALDYVTHMRSTCPGQFAHLMHRHGTLSIGTNTLDISKLQRVDEIADDLDEDSPFVVELDALTINALKYDVVHINTQESVLIVCRQLPTSLDEEGRATLLYHAALDIFKQDYADSIGQGGPPPEETVGVADSTEMREVSLRVDGPEDGLSESQKETSPPGPMISVLSSTTTNVESQSRLPNRCVIL